MIDAKKISTFCEAQVKKRQLWDNLFQEASDYVSPVRGEFTTENVGGENKFDHLFDDTGPWALDTFSSGLQSAMMSSLSRWMGMELKDRQQREDKQMLEWRDHALEVSFDIYNDMDAGLYPMVRENFWDMGLTGYGVGYSTWGEGDLNTMLYHARFPGESYMIEDLHGRIIGIVRRYKLDTYQFVQEFGEDKLPERCRERYKAGQAIDEDHKITHLVLDKKHPVVMGHNRPNSHKVVGVYIMTGKAEDVLKEEGYRSFPFHVARWNRRAGSVYSTSPVITALPAIRRANAIARDLIIIANRQGDPPTQGPDDGNLPNLSPGAHSFYPPGTQDRIETIQTLGDLNAVLAVLQETQQSIRNILYTDAFLTTADSNGQNVKAAFVYQRRDERFRQLTSATSRLEREYKGSIVMRTLEEAIENGRIEPPPQAEAPIEPVYLSPITRAQRSEVVEAVNVTLETLAPFAQIDPSVFKAFNGMELAQLVGRDVGQLPVRVFKAIEEIREELAAQDQAEAMAGMQQQAEIAATTAGAIKDVADADLSVIPG